MASRAPVCRENWRAVSRKTALPVAAGHRRGGIRRIRAEHHQERGWCRGSARARRFQRYDAKTRMHRTRRGAASPGNRCGDWRRRITGASRDPHVAACRWGEPRSGGALPVRAMRLDRPICSGGCSRSDPTTALHGMQRRCRSGRRRAGAYGAMVPSIESSSVLPIAAPIIILVAATNSPCLLSQ